MLCLFSLFFTDTATPHIYTYWHTLSLHDSLPISASGHSGFHSLSRLGELAGDPDRDRRAGARRDVRPQWRAESQHRRDRRRRRPADAGRRYHLTAANQAPPSMNRSSAPTGGDPHGGLPYALDRKSTRLNSSH